MATDSHAKSVHNTLTSTTADTVAITGFDVVDVINRHTTEALWVRYEGDDSPTTAVAADDGTDYVAPSGFLRIDAGGTEGGKISIVGNANPYSVVGVSA